MKLFNLFLPKDKRTAKRKLGDKGEDIAVRYLKENGYTILERNWTHGKNEIDIIALDKETVVFVEVKTTARDSAEDFKLPSEAVDHAKRKCLTDCARAYIPVRKRVEGMFYADLYRFDVIEVYLNRDEPEINHIQDAFFAEKGTKNKWKT